MNSFRIAISELRRLTTTRMGRIVVAALIIVPTLYAGLYLYANHDPYGNLKNVPAAIVVKDTGTTLADGTALNAGDKVARELIESRSFDWREVSETEAEQGVKNGDFDFALLIPEGFSDAFGATSNFNPTQAQLTMVTNDANSYLATTIADRVSQQVKESISTAVSQEAATTFLTGLASVRGQLLKAADGADQLHDGITKAHDGSGDLLAGARRLDNGADQLSDGLGQLKSQTASLPDQTRKLARGARQVADGNAQVAEVGREVGGASTRIKDAYDDGREDLTDRLVELGLTAEQKKEILAVYDRLGTPIRDGNTTVQGAVKDLNRLASGADEVADGNEQLAAATPDLVAGISQAASGASRLADGTGELRTGARTLNQGLGQLSQGSAKLATKLRNGAQDIPDSTDESRDKLAKTIGNPVAITNASDATAGSYGAGLAPFFLALAAWIGGYVLFTQVRPLSRRATAANQTPVRVALGGWMAPALLGLAQMSIALAVVSAGVGIVPANIIGTLVFMMLISAVFIAIVHALCAWWDLAGLFLGLVLMVVQLVTAGGTFPWQTIPQPLHLVHHIMPMSYAVDGLRQLMYGGLDARVATDVVVLLGWFLLAIFASSRAARRQRMWTPKQVAESLAS